MKWPRANYGPNEEPRGCGCGCQSTRVTHTETEGKTKYRRRLCNGCGEKYTSTEQCAVHGAPVA